MKFCNIFSLYALAVLITTGCDHAPKLSQSATSYPASEPSKPTTFSPDFLLGLLKKNDLNDFYAEAKKLKISELRKFFESHADNKKYNYGALLNANIITPENRKLFKPDVAQLDYFAGVPNPENSTCWFGAAIMAMAAGELFDDFLEIDKKVGDKWKNRPTAVKKDVDNLLRTLRTLIYELRLGPLASQQRILALTKELKQNIIILGDENKRAIFFRELMENYDFQKKIVISKDKTNNKKLAIQHVNYSAEEKDKIAKLALPDTFGFYEPTKCLIDKKGANPSLLLRTLFIMLDPFGKTARYLSFADLKDDLKTESIYNLIWTGLTIESHGQNTKIIIDTSPHAKVSLLNDNKIDFSELLELLDQGVILPPWSENNAMNNKGINYEVKLIAKNLESARHAITILYNQKLNKWEMHDDARQAVFSRAPDIDGYADENLYFARKK